MVLYRGGDAMLEFIILMVVLDILLKIKVGSVVKAEEPPKPKPQAYVNNNTAAWDFKSLDDAMEYREMRLSGWKGNAIDFYKWKEEE